MTLATAFDLHPDELLYSAVARHAAAMRYPRQRAVLAAAFGCSSGIAVVDLPTHLDALAAGVVPNVTQASPAAPVLTGERLAWRHTLLPYYAPFVPSDRLRRVEECMRQPRQDGANGSHVHGALGVRASTVPTPNAMRYCPGCVTDDRRQFGAAYWHRSHQVPAALWCAAHDLALRDSTIRRAGRSARLTFHALDHVLGTSKPRRDDSTVLARLAGPSTAAVSTNGVIPRRWRPQLRWLAHAGGVLLATMTPATMIEVWAREREALSAAGYVTSGGHVRVRLVREAFKAHYGADLLAHLGCPLGSAQLEDWLARLLRAPKRAHDPLRHLLLAGMLSLPIDTLVRSATTCESTSAAGGDRAPGAAASDVRSTAAAADTPLADGTHISRVTHASRAAPDGFADAEQIALLRALVDNHTMSLRAIARRLAVTPRTVQRWARRVGVWRVEWRTWERSAPRAEAAARRRLAAAHRTSARHRSRWLALCAAAPGRSVTDVRRLAPATYSYLYRYDRSWLDDHTPATPTSMNAAEGSATMRHRAQDARDAKGSQARTRARRVDWPARDRALVRVAEQAVEALRLAPGRPLWLRRTTILRQMGLVSLIEQRADRLPATMAFLAQAVEPPLEFARRKLAWAAAAFAARGEVPARWVFVRTAGLRAQLATVLDSEVQHHLDVLSAWASDRRGAAALHAANDAPRTHAA